MNNLLTIKLAHENILVRSKKKGSGTVVFFSSSLFYRYVRVRDEKCSDPG
jgi:hypothetical protein